MSRSPWRDEMDELLQEDGDTLCLQPSDVDMLLEETLDETQATTTPPTIERVDSKVENWAAYKQKKAEEQKAKEDRVQKAREEEEQKAKKEQVLRTTQPIQAPSSSSSEGTLSRFKQYSTDGKRYAIKKSLVPSLSSALSSQSLNQLIKRQVSAELSSNLPKLGQPVYRLAEPVIKSIADRGREREEKLHQQRIKLILQEKRAGVEKRLEQEKVKKEKQESLKHQQVRIDQERREKEEKELEQLPNEDDMSYLRRLDEIQQGKVSMFSSPSNRGRSSARRQSPMPQRSSQPRHTHTKPRNPAKFVDFMAKRDKESNDRTKHAPCKQSRSPPRKNSSNFAYKQPQKMTGETSAERQVVEEEVPEVRSKIDLREFLKSSKQLPNTTQSTSQTSAMGLGLSDYRHQHNRNLKMRELERKRGREISVGGSQLLPGRLEPPQKKKKSEPNWDKPETLEQYFHFRLKLSKSNVWDEEDLWDTPLTSEFDEEDKEEMNEKYHIWAKDYGQVRVYINREINHRRYHVLFAEDETPKSMAKISIKNAIYRVRTQLQTNINTIRATRFKILYRDAKNFDETFAKKIIQRSYATGILLTDHESKIFPAEKSGKRSFTKPLWMAVAIGDIDGMSISSRTSQRSPFCPESFRRFPPYKNSIRHLERCVRI